MMQMLAAGGLAVLADQQRKKDASNPKGYYELERIKRLRESSDWITEARGKAVKIISQLLEHLPEEDYQIVCMQRDLNEIVKSQRTMLERTRKQGTQLSDLQLKRVYEKHLECASRMLKEKSVPFTNISYRGCVENPSAAAAEVNRFLGSALDEEAMAAAVDSELYRERFD